MSAPQFNIVRIYTLDLSVEVPGGAESFVIEDKQQPQVKIGIQHRSRHFRDDLYEVVLTIKVETHVADRPLFVVEVEEGGLFQLQNIPQEDIPHLLHVSGSEILFPYLREIVSNVTQNASFPPILLAPINFEAMYQQSFKEMPDKSVLIN